MRLNDLIKLQAIGNEWLETYGSYSLPSTQHPPSLKNPQQVKIPTAQDGWKKGDSKAARKQAEDDLMELHKRVRRQIGKPEISHVAPIPLFPDQTRWL